MPKKLILQVYGNIFVIVIKKQDRTNDVVL